MPERLVRVIVPRVAVLAGKVSRQFRASKVAHSLPVDILLECLALARLGAVFSPPEKASLIDCQNFIGLVVC